MKRKIRIDCDNCKGHGKFEDGKICLVCNGDGYLIVIKKMNETRND